MLKNTENRMHKSLDRAAKEVLRHRGRYAESAEDIMLQTHNMAQKTRERILAKERYMRHEQK